MTKRTIAALGCALCAVAAGARADTVNVEVYGTLLPFLDSAKVYGATATPLPGGPSQVPATAYTGLELPARGRLTAGTSNLGFRGSVSIDGPWKAIFQVEAAVPVDGDQAPLGLLASRNTHVGLSGPFGTLFYGIWDTPYKWTTIMVAPLRGLNPFDYDNVLENPGFNVPGTTTQSGRVAGKPDAAFSRRQGNSIQYWTPSIYGFNGRAGYSLNEGRAQVTGGSKFTSPDVISGSIGYDHQLFTVRYSYEQHDDYFGMAQLGGSAGATVANPSSKDRAHKVMAGLLLPDTKLFGVVERLRYDTADTNATAVNHYQRDAWFVEAVQKFGDFGLWGSFGKGLRGECAHVNGSACVTDKLGAIMYSVGTMYDFGKRTTVYASFYGVVTEDAAQYTIFPSVGPVTPGSDTRAFGLGILHWF